MTPITTADLTTGAIAGSGVFDVLMESNKAHIEAEYSKGRITGADYSTVYLGMVQATLSASVQFLMQRDKIALEADLLQQQIANATKQGLLIDKQIEDISKDIELKQVQINLAPKQEALLDAQICKLKAEFDLTMANLTKTGKETDLLAQKIVTEKAQVLELGVDDNSVIGKQKALYTAQTDGFARDAEQKVAKLLTDTWNARRMTDDGTVADDVNKLNDATIGRAVVKMLTGVGA